MKLINRINRILNKKFGFEIHLIYNLVYRDKNKDYLWRERAHFDKVFNTIKDYTVVDKERCYILYQFLRHSLSLIGDIAEVGVYRGGTARLIAEISANTKNIYLFDTFLGLPKADTIDTSWKGGEFADTSVKQVENYLSKFRNNIEINKGFFPETAVHLKEKRFCFVHIDVDIYRSTYDCCDFFYSQMVKGGIIIFDDYGFIGCEGVKRAVDEFFSSKMEFPIYLTSGQGLIIKI